MAGDWIPIRVLIGDDPKVIQMADYLAEQGRFITWLTDPAQRLVGHAYEHNSRHVIIAIVVKGLVRVWGVANESGKTDGHDQIIRAGIGAIDAIADVPCFGTAMEFAGWAVAENLDGKYYVRFPNFLEMNVPVSDRKRSSNAERQQRHRDRSRNASGVTESVTGSVTRNAKSNATGQDITGQERKKGGLAPPPLPSEEIAAPGQSGNDAPCQQEFLDAWNALASAKGLAKANAMTSARTKALRVRCKDGRWLEGWREALARVASTPFLCGANERGWKADIDWFLKPDSVTKILEGKYATSRPIRDGPTRASNAEIIEKNLQERAESELRRQRAAGPFRRDGQRDAAAQ